MRPLSVGSPAITTVFQSSPGPKAGRSHAEGLRVNGPK